MYDNTAPQGLRGWWASPPRSGSRRFISPWVYRHPRGFARVHIAAGVVLASLGVITFTVGGGDSTASWFSLVFLGAAAVHVAGAAWLLRIARS